MGMTLKLYKSTEIDNSVALDASQLADTVEINGVEFGHPSGTIRLNSSLMITHFAAQFPEQWGMVYTMRTIIYKITSKKWINSSVAEFSYTVDLLKTWWLHNGGSNLFSAFRVLRYWPTSDPVDAMYKQWLNDPEDKPTGGIDYRITDEGINCFSNVWALLVNSYSLDPSSGDRDQNHLTKTYLLNYGQLHALIYFMNTSAYGNAFYKQVAGLYKVPGAVYNTSDSTFNIRFIGTTYTSIDYIGKDEDGNVVTESMGTGFLVSTGGNSDPPSTIYDTGLSITFENYRDIYHTKYTLYVPYVGDIDIPAALLIKTARNQTTSFTINLYITYSYNFMDGSFNISFADTSNVTTNPALTPYFYQAPLPMPTNALPTGAQALSFYANEVAIKGQMISSTANVVSNLATGNYVGAGVSLLNQGVSMYQNELKNDIITASGQSYGNMNGWGGSYKTFFSLITIREVFKNSLSTFRAKNGYLVDDYVDISDSEYNGILENYYDCVLLDAQSGFREITNEFAMGIGCDELMNILSKPIRLKPVYNPFSL